MNKVFLIGNLTKDPELKETQSGISVCNFSIAVKRRYAKDGEQETDFFNCMPLDKAEARLAELKGEKE